MPLQAQEESEDLPSPGALAAAAASGTGGLQARKAETPAELLETTDFENPKPAPPPSCLHFPVMKDYQRRRDDDKNKICTFDRGAGGRRGKSSKNAVFHGKRHDNKFSKVQIYCRECLLSLRRLLDC